VTEFEFNLEQERAQAELENKRMSAKRLRVKEIEGAQTNLRLFTKSLWSVRESTPFQDNWVIGALCEHLTACYERQIRRLIINIFPRSLKSSLASVFFPAWVWGQKPGERLLTIANAQDLALSFALHSRQLIASPEYQSLFGNKFQILSEQSAKGNYENNMLGVRRSIGTGGQITGFGGNRIFDDPNDVIQVESPAERVRINNWFDNSVTRSDDFLTDFYIIIQQRTHPKDLTGHIDELGLPYEKLVIPLEYKGKNYVTSLGLCDPRTKQDEVAIPERFPPDTIAEFKKSLGYRFSGQANQDPGVPEGDAVKRIWYEPYVHLFNPEDIVSVRLAYDVAFTDSEDGDWTWGSLKAKRKNAPKDEWINLTLWQHFGHWDNARRRKEIGQYGLQVAQMMKVLFPNVKWKLTLEAGIGGATEVVKEDIKHLQGLGLPAETVTPAKQAKPVRAIAYLSSCQGGFTKFYAGVQLMDFGMSDGTNKWIKPFLDIVSLLKYSDDGLEFKGGKDDPIDGEVMAHDGVTKPENWNTYFTNPRKTTT
jgi:hypothetical protein